MKNFLFFVAAALVIVSGCAGSRTLSGARPNNAVLVIKNEHPMSMEIQVDGKEYVIPAHAGIDSIPVHCGTVYKITRRMYPAEGKPVKMEDAHIPIPEGATEKVVIFGGPQYGRIFNQSGVGIVAVGCPDGSIAGPINSGLPPSEEIALLPGKEYIFRIKFEDGRVISVLSQYIDDVTQDNLVAGKFWVDWFMIITQNTYLGRSN